MKLALRVVAVVAVLFGAATIYAGGNVLFGSGAAAAGSYVPFVVWFNFLAGFAYVGAGIGIWLAQPWARPLAAWLALLTAVVFAAFGAYVALGGAYELRTVGAMTLRTLVWTGIAALLMAAARREEKGS
jgi:hypothetical protein